MTAQGFFYVCAGIGCLLLSMTFVIALLMSAARTERREQRAENEALKMLDIEKAKRENIESDWETRYGRE